MYYTVKEQHLINSILIKRVSLVDYKGKSSVIVDYSNGNRLLYQDLSERDYNQIKMAAKAHTDTGQKLPVGNTIAFWLSEYRGTEVE